MLRRLDESKLWPETTHNAEIEPCELGNAAAHHGQTVRQLLISTVSEY
jgi:hypothetical protein